MTNNKNTLLRGRLLAKNSAYSFIGIILPILAGLIAIPFILDELEEEQFGLLILLWSTISYITVLDFGLNRAATRYFSQNIGQLNERENLSLLISSIVFVLVIGFLIGLILYNGSEFLVSTIFEEESRISLLADKCFKLISFFSPVLVLMPTVSSFLKSYQNFKWLSFVNSINGVMNYIIPVIALLMSFSLFDIIKVLLAAKVVTLLALIAGSMKYLEFSVFSFSGVKLVKDLKKLIKFGSWVSVSNILAPLFEYLDRFIIASFITVSAVAIYGTPLEVIVKVGMIAVSVSGVLFAAISNSIEHDLKKTEKIINKGLDVITLLTYPIIVTAVLFAEEGLTVWVGEGISREGAIVLKIVGIGILFKCTTNISIAFLHSVNKPSVTAKIHLIEFIVYAVLLFVFANLFGLIGVAIAHAGRLILDNILMGYFAQKYSTGMNLLFLRNSGIIGILILTMIPAFIVPNTYIKFAWWLVLGIIYVFYMYKNTDSYKKVLLN